jgi:electron transport complex protein RnfB
MSQDIYRQVQERLDLHSMGFPATESGIEIDILKYLFTKEDAAMFLTLTPAVKTPQAIAELVNQPVEDTAALLDDMAQRGLIFRLKKNGVSKYGSIAFVHGIFEFQVKTLKPDLAKMAGQYFEEAFDSAMQKSAEYFLRVIPVNQSIEVTNNVASYDDAVQILKSKDKIIITDCICRKRAHVIDEGCGKQMEACFMFGSMGQYYLDSDMGREISITEAIEILEKCHEEGLVTQAATSQNPTGMCNCCGDCCGVLRAIGLHPEPASMVFSNHLITADTNECIGCEVCLERCQMDALTLNEDEVVEISENRCIGCGLCVTTCPTDALSLIEKPEKEMRLPPETMGEQMMEMAKKRGLV